MVTIIPNEGLNWISEKTVDDSPAVDQKIYEIAVGTGTNTGAVTPTNTQLQTELFRANADNGVASISATSNIGEVECKVTVSGGTEIPAGTDVSEFGVWAIDPTDSTAPYQNGSEIIDANDVMLYHEVRAGVTIDSGDTKTFTIRFTVTDN